jgi:hypothetical protein
MTCTGGSIGHCGLRPCASFCLSTLSDRPIPLQAELAKGDKANASSCAGHDNLGASRYKGLYSTSGLFFISWTQDGRSTSAMSVGMPWCFLAGDPGKEIPSRFCVPLILVHNKIKHAFSKLYNRNNVVGLMVLP